MYIHIYKKFNDMHHHTKFQKNNIIFCLPPLSPGHGPAPVGARCCPQTTPFRKSRRTHLFMMGRDINPPSGGPCPFAYIFLYHHV